MHGGVGFLITALCSQVVVCWRPSSEVSLSRETPGGDPYKFESRASFLQDDSDPPSKGERKSTDEKEKSESTGERLQEKILNKAPPQRKTWIVVLVATCIAAIIVVGSVEVTVCLAIRCQRKAKPGGESLEEELNNTLKLAERLQRQLVEKQKMEYDEEEAKAKQDRDAMRAKMLDGEIPHVDMTPAEKLEAIDEKIRSLKYDESMGGLYKSGHRLHDQVTQAVARTKMTEVVAKAEIVRGEFDQMIHSLKDRSRDFVHQEADTIYGWMRNVATEFLPQAEEIAEEIGGITQAGKDLRQQGEHATAAMQDAKKYLDEKLAEKSKELSKSFPALGVLGIAYLVPTWLRWLRGGLVSTLILDSVQLSVLVGVAANAWTREGAKLVWAWVFCAGAVCAVGIFVTTALLVRVVRVMLRVEEYESDMQKTETGHPIWDSFINIKQNSAGAFLGVYEYDKLSNSWMYLGSRLMFVFRTVVGVAALVLTLKSHVEYTVLIETQGLVFLMHLWAFIYTLLLTWNLLYMFYWFLCLLSSTPCFKGYLIRTALSWDVTLPAPFFTLVLQWFFLTPPADIVAGHYEAKKRETEKLKENIAKKQSKLDETTLLLEELQKEEAYERAMEEDLIRTFEKSVLNALEDARPWVLFMSSQFDKAGEEGIDLEGEVINYVKEMFEHMTEGVSASEEVQNLREQFQKAMDGPVKERRAQLCEFIENASQSHIEGIDKLKAIGKFFKMQKAAAFGDGNAFDMIEKVRAQVDNAAQLIVGEAANAMNRTESKQAGTEALGRVRKARENLQRVGTNLSTITEEISGGSKPDPKLDLPSNTSFGEHDTSIGLFEEGTVARNFSGEEKTGRADDERPSVSGKPLQRSASSIG